MVNNRMWETFEELTSIDSPSLGERELCDVLRAKLEDLGASVYEDDAGVRINGNCGNLYAFLDGEGEPILLSAHMDTVEPAKGKRAVLHDGGLITSAGDTVLGADDVSGITSILEAIRRLQENGTTHRPIELLFTVAEEIFCGGSAYTDYSKLKARQAYVLDTGGEIGEGAHAAPTVLHFTIRVKGKAAHAGFAPQDGIHAIAVAARAIARLEIGRTGPDTTLNIGKISGGNGINVVPDTCEVAGEIRSLRHDEAVARFEELLEIFHQEADKAGARIEADQGCSIKAYEVPLDGEVVKRYEDACAAVGVTARIHSTMGGSDNNNYVPNGISGLVIACSMHEVHSVREYCNIDEMEKCVQVVMKLLV